MGVTIPLPSLQDLVPEVPPTVTPDWMTYLSLLALAVGLAIDSAAVAASRGLAAKRVTLWSAGLLVGLFGGMQALMAVVGWVFGSAVGPFIEGWAKWIAAALLFGVGLKMIHESFEEAGPHPLKAAAGPFRLRLLILLAIATSIDSLAAGIALPLLQAPLFLSVGMIGITTAALSGAGLWAGRRFGLLLGRRLDAAGGVVLILIALRTVF